MSRRLDALFAERVLGCKVRYGYGPDPCPVCKGSKIAPKAEHYVRAHRTADPHVEDIYVKAGDPCGQCGGKGEVSWFGDGPFCRCEKYGQHNDDRAELLSYTTSLDAAWQGAPVGLNVVQLSSSAVAMLTNGGMQPPDFLSPAERPAMAVVLCRLRAVGVSEEEIEEARQRLSTILFREQGMAQSLRDEIGHAMDRIETAEWILESNR
jgi:hypothetical protein